MSHPDAASADVNGSPSAVAGPLDGVRVLELGTLLAGPFAARLLGDLGAEIIKVETPGAGDPLRDWGHARHEGRSLWWPIQSRNKKSVTLNLRDERGQRLVLALAAECDAVVENFRPGTLERWNIGWEQLQAVNPGIILARVSGFGQTGPYAARAGFAAVAEAMGGLRYINGVPGEPPPRAGISLGDSLAGMFAAQGVIAALYRRDARGGAGQIVDVSLLESCFALLEGAVPEYDKLGVVRQPTGTGLKGVVPSNIFRARDDKWLVIAANQDTVFRRLCATMEREELATDPRFATHLARCDHAPEIEAEIADWAAQRDSDEIESMLNTAGVACGPINTVADIVADPHFQAREMLVTHRDPDLGDLLGPGIVPKLSGTPGTVRWTGPSVVGAHTDEVYRDLLGLTDAELDELRREGVV